MFAPVGTEEIIPRKKFSIVTAAIVVLNSLFFIYEMFILFTRGAEGFSSFVNGFGLVPAALTSGRSILLPFYITIFTSMFMHAGLFHITFNMIYLAVFGDNVEELLGPWLYMTFYLACGLVAAFVQIAADPTSMIPNVGASGAISGVLAGYLVFFPTGTVRMFLFLGPFSRITKISALLFISIWFIMQLSSGVASLGVATEAGGVAYWAHIGGFLAGLVLAFIYKQIIISRLY